MRITNFLTRPTSGGSKRAAGAGCGSRWWLGWIALAAGCVPVHIPGGDTGNGDGTPTPPEFTVQLEVSNPTPQVDEEVSIQCLASGTFTQPLTYAFDSSTDRLQTNPNAGTASVIVSQPDQGSTISISCSATDAEGHQATSSVVHITPT